MGDKTLKARFEKDMKMISDHKAVIIEIIWEGMIIKRDKGLRNFQYDKQHDKE